MVLTGDTVVFICLVRKTWQRVREMQIPVLIETGTYGYRATTGQPLVLSADGATREEALGQLREAMKTRLSVGAEIAALEIISDVHPLAPYAGMYKHNPLFDSWQQAIADYRRQADEATESP